MGTCGWRRVCYWFCFPFIWFWDLCCRAAACLRRCLCRGGEETWLLEEPPEERGRQKWEKQRSCCICIEKELPIKVHVTGQTAGCENKFLMKVSDYLSGNFIHLKNDDFSAHFLLIFCPVVSRVGTDMQNAVADLSGETKVILVMLHHIPKESNRFVDPYLQAHHPAVVRTVHACYTLDDGLFTCQVNEEAVNTVAEVLKYHCTG
ncbi:uncharacterized protein [Anolis sagrei]|uniref:uncharacterized protein n=1 Tax=Anolis sagrei TaxID=38937 RepID=UPI003522D8D7